MGRIWPAFLALILNWFGFQMFFIPVHFPTSPFVSSIIVSFAVYFTLLQCNLYPLRLRKIPRLFTRLYEFVASQFLIEFVMCNVWFPLETFMFITLANIAESMKRIVKSRNPVFPITSKLSSIFQHYATGICLSYFLSISSLLLVLHVTYIIDLDVLRKCGVIVFLKDCNKALKEGVKKLFTVKVCPCKPHTTTTKATRRRGPKRRFTIG